MLDLSCTELASIVEGELRLGLLPPLGGGFEPIGPIVTDVADVAGGELFWAFEHCEVEHAWARGAGGIVAPRRRGTPRDGAFAIEVDDVGEALCRLARWQRASLCGRVVLLLGADGASAAQLIRDATATARDGARRDEARPSVATCGRQLAPLHAAALSLLSASVESPVTCLTLGDLPGPVGDSKKLDAFEEISHLCCPHVVCITSLSVGDDASRIAQAVLAELPDDGGLVLPADDERMRGLPRVITVGEHPQCTMQVRRRPSRPGREEVVELEWSGRRLSTTAGEPAVRAALGVLTALGANVQRLIQQLRPKRSAAK